MKRAWIVCAALFGLVGVSGAQTPMPMPEIPPPLGTYLARYDLYIITNRRVASELNFDKAQQDALRKAAGDYNLYKGRTMGPRSGLTPEQRFKKQQEILADTDKVVAAILKPEQRTRARNIILQSRGFVIAWPEVITELKLTSDQQNKLSKLYQDYRTVVSKVVQSYSEGMNKVNSGQGDASSIASTMMKSMADAKSKAETSMMAVLTPAQKKTWTQLVGKPFEFGRGRG